MRIDLVDQILCHDLAAATGHGDDLDAVAARKMLPDVDVIRVLALGADDDLVASLPRISGGNDVDAFGDVFGNGDLVGVGADQPREFRARGLDDFEHLSLVAAIQAEAVKVAVDRLA
jgi:hypothetical protein